MDYVVYGTGYGATLMLLGYAIRTWGPGWRFRDADAAAYDGREFRSARSSWRRFTSGLGAAVATAGAALVLLTFVIMLIRPSDELGGAISLVVSGLLLAGVAVWAWMFFSRFGAWGIVATPNALTNYGPATYDSRAAQIKAATVADEAGEGSGDADVDELVDEEEPDLADDDEAELRARYSKFELHHPEGEQGADDLDTAPDEKDDDRHEAPSADDASQHPDDQAGSVDEEHTADADDDRIEAIEEYVEALTPEEVSEDIVANADEEPVSDEGVDAPIETYEDLVSHSGKGRGATGDAPVDAAGDAAEHDPLEVLPEAHEDIAPLLPSEPEPRQEPGGRDDALRRLRERQAERARKRAADDA